MTAPGHPCREIAFPHDIPMYNESVRLYSAGFPGEQAVFPPAEMLRTWVSGKRRIWVCTPGGTVSAMAVAMPLSVSGDWLLEYMVVEEGLRGQGVGGSVLSAISHDALLEGVRRIWIECRHPDECRSVGDHDCAVRRIAFYTRNGAARVPFYPDHAFPDFSVGRPGRRVLLQLPVAARHPVTRGELIAAVLDILQMSYLGTDSYIVPRHSSGVV